MTLPVYLHSGMAGAPALMAGDNFINPILNACLVNGFNLQSVVSATASGGVVTFNFPTAPGFSAKDTVKIEGASNALVNVSKRVQSAANNQVLVAIPGVPDGAVGGTITLKFSPLGWTRPFSDINVGAYRTGGSASHKRWLRVYDGPAGDYRYYARGYEDMSDLSTGDGPFPTPSERGGDGMDALRFYGAGPAPWVLVGTPRAFYFMSGYSGVYDIETPPRFYAAARDMGCFFFGEYARVQKPGDAYAFGIPGGYNFPQSAMFGSRDWTSGPGTRSSETWMAGPFGAHNILGGDCNYPDPASGNLVLLDAPWVREYSTGQVCMRGVMPGMMLPVQRPHYAGIPAGAIFDNINGVTGRALLMHGYLLQGGEFTLLLDEDWGDT